MEHLAESRHSGLVRKDGTADICVILGTGVAGQYRAMRNISATAGNCLVTKVTVHIEGFNGIGSAIEITDPAVPGANKHTMMRVANMNTYVTSSEALGFQTANIPYSDTYTAIQTNLADGWTGGPPNLNYLYFRDVINYFYDYRQCAEVNNYQVNAAAFNSLLPQDQEAIRELCAAACEESFARAEADGEIYKQMLRDYGVEVVEFTDEEYAAMAAYVQENAWPQLADSFTQEFLDGVEASLPAAE